MTHRFRARLLAGYELSAAALALSSIAAGPGIIVLRRIGA
jgi:hypothetical protein